MSRRSLSLLILAVAVVALAVIFWPRAEQTDKTEPAPAREPVVAKLAENPETGMVQDKAERPEPVSANLPSAAPPATAEIHTGDEEALSPTRTAVRLYGNAKVRPLYNLHDNTIAGVEISNVAPGSFWDELGVGNGDVILELNGEVIDTPAASVELMNQFSRGFVLNLRLRTAEGLERFIDYRTPPLP
ncbi:MAG: hypothetical protein NZ990_10980 [Myxococcota bacterium]|nr:hypothetical protein [Myxococcota bacterium]